MTRCTKCGSDKGVSEDGAAKIRQHRGPPLPVGLCVRCAMEDPVLRGEVHRWARERRDEFVSRIRVVLARPLEIIDEVVERFR